MRIPISILFFLFTCSQSLFAQKVFDDKVFEENIQSVRLFPASVEYEAQLSSPVIELNSGIAMNLTFDDLAYDPDMYSAKIIHCNFDWTPSDLIPDPIQ
jgi:hypothetical protein